MNFHDLEKDISTDRFKRSLFLIFLLALCATHHQVFTGVRVCVGFMAIAGLTFPKLASREPYWLAISWALFLNLIPNYSTAANHYWLTVYVSFAILIGITQKNSPKYNLFRCLLIIVFGLATVQKLISPYFFSGRLLGDYFLSDRVLSNTISFIRDNHAAFISAYQESFLHFNHLTVFDGAASPILVDPWFISFCQALAVIIIIFEAVIFISLASNKLFKFSFSQWSILVFIWATFPIREEYSFFALLSLLIFLAKPNSNIVLKALSLLSIFAFLAFSVGNF